jgi:hypothetical protein
MCGLRPDRTIYCADTDGALDVPSGTFKDVAVGERTQCGVRDDGTVTCWAFPKDYPEPSIEGHDFAKIFVDNNHGCAQRQDGTLSCWREVNYGNQAQPVGSFVQVDLAKYVGCGLDMTGLVTCWGSTETWD